MMRLICWLRRKHAWIYMYPVDCEAGTRTFHATNVPLKDVFAVKRMCTICGEVEEF